MSWKDWPYWLRGGIVGLVIGIILIFVIFPLMLVSSQIFFSCVDFNGLSSSSPPFSCNILGLVYPTSYTLINISLWAVYGIIIGWVVGKLKNK